MRYETVKDEFRVGRREMNKEVESLRRERAKRRWSCENDLVDKGQTEDQEYERESKKKIATSTGSQKKNG